MKHSVSVAAFMLLLCAAVAPAQTPLPEAKVKDLDLMVEKALAAYNAQDWKVFYADFAKSMASISTEQAFKTMFADQYMKSLGKYESRAMIKGESVLMGDFPLFVYEAKFAQSAKVKVSVNFTKEGDLLKLMQVRFDKL